MAVNKGEIGIYGVLRRDGGDGVLAYTDLIKDKDKGLTLESINSSVLILLGSKVDKEAGKGLITDTEKDKLKYINSSFPYCLKIGSSPDYTDHLSIEIIAGTSTTHSIFYISNDNIYLTCGNEDVFNLTPGSALYLGNTNLGNIITGTCSFSNYVNFTNEVVISSSISLGTSTIEFSSNENQLKIDLSGNIVIGSDARQIQIGTGVNVLSLSTYSGLAICVSQINICNSTLDNILRYNGTSLELGDYYVSGDMYMCMSSNETNILLSELLKQKYDSTISRTQNTVLAAPTSADGTATFRKLELSDMPDLSGKYLALNGNGYQLKPKTMGLLAGFYDNSTGYIKASIPSNRSEKNSSSWYYATDGSLLDINDSVTRLKANKTVEDLNIKVDGTNYPTGYIQLNPYNNHSDNAPEVSIYNNNSVITYYIGSYGHDEGYGYLIACSHYGNLFFRKWEISNYSDWKKFAFTDSDITGNSATTTKLKTPVTLWGLSFDGSKSVTGVLEMNGSALSLGKNANDNYEIKLSNDILQLNKFGVGYLVSISEVGMFINGDKNTTRKATEKLEVNGNVKSKEYLLSDGSKYAEQCLESDITALFN